MPKQAKARGQKATKLTLNPKNPRTITEEKRARLRDTMARLGDLGGIVYNRRTKTLISGNQRTSVIGEGVVPTIEKVFAKPTKTGTVGLGFIDHEGERFACRIVDWDRKTEREALIAANVAAGEWDYTALAKEFDPEELEDWGIDASFMAETEGPKGDPRSLSSKFGVAPFSVLNAREGWWQDRKRAWISLGIASELGRGEEEGGSSPALLKNVQMADSGYYLKKRTAEKALKRKLSDEEFVEKYYRPSGSGATSGSSVFDPVLAELLVRWFTPEGAKVLDPFAGGSVRGIVTAKLGRNYTGVELRPAQVKANRAQASEILAVGKKERGSASWVCGDSSVDIPRLGYSFDFVFSCPPYADLEVYSDNPADLSTKKYPAFLRGYRDIIAKACAKLKKDRFAAFVVGEIRDDRGGYRNFVSDTIAAFLAAGLSYYNEAILVTAVASTSLRAGRQFEGSRKLGKTHQNVLVFVKGDAKKAAAYCGVCDFGGTEEGSEKVKEDLADDEVRVSAAMARLEFIECGPACISAGCSGNCCDAPTRKTGCLVTINPDEKKRIEKLGGTVVDGLLQPKPGEKGCPFKAKGLCTLHDSGQKPWGCVASPFTLNAKGTLVVRNRYKLLPCYRNDGPKGPAYRTFRSSLELIFGKVETARITAHLDAGGGDLIARVDPAVKAKLFENDAIKSAIR